MKRLKMASKDPVRDNIQKLAEVFPSVVTETIDEKGKLIRAELDTDHEGVNQAQIDEWYLREVKRTGEKIDLLRLSATGKPEHYIPPTDSKLASDLWVDLSPRGSSETKNLFGLNIFDNPKPTGWIERILRYLRRPSFPGYAGVGPETLPANGQKGYSRQKSLLCRR